MIFKAILWVVFIGVLFIRKYYERLAAQNIEAGVETDMDNPRHIQIQIFILAVSGISLLIYLVNSNWMAWAHSEFPEWLSWVGVGAGVIGTPLLFWTHYTLGKNFFGGMKIGQDHKIVTDGPYQWMRHPMYTAFFLIGFSYWFLSENWMVGIPWMLGAIHVVLTRMKPEEEMMVEKFGEIYLNYQKSTGRFLPKLF